MHNFYTEAFAEPTKALREASTHAEVGNSLTNDDPTTRALLERVAAFLGKEAALFMCSGTMCNEVAIRAHVQPGQEIICERSSHIINFEVGAPAALSGAMIHAIDGTRGMFTADQTRSAIRSGNPYYPDTGLIIFEQTANMAGGAVWPLEQLRQVADVANQHGIKTHMDGARLINAVVATGVEAAEMAKGYDSVFMDFCKALGCPAGAVLAGPNEFIARAWRIRQMIGGGIRRTGMMAAMCNYALDQHVDRIAEDHALAKYLEESIANIRGVSGVLPVDTNIVMVDFDSAGPNAATIVAKLRDEGFIVGAFGPHRIRIVTFLGQSLTAGEQLCVALDKILNEQPC